jgi:hypothetical protein
MDLNFADSMKLRNLSILLILLTGPLYGSPYSVFVENGKSGVKNSSGQVVIPALYEEIGWSSREFSVINNVTGYRLGSSWGLINIRNQRVTKAEFEELVPFGSSLIIARRKTRTSISGMVGCINSAGKEIIPFIYDGIMPASLRAVVFTKIGNQYRYGLIDLANKTIIPQQYQSVRTVGSLRYIVRNFEGKSALFSEDGRQLTGFSIDSISSFHYDHAILFEGHQMGIISRSGEIKLPATYRDIILKPGGVAEVRESDTWHFLDPQNKLIRTERADSISAVGRGFYKKVNAGQVQVTDGNLKGVGSGVFNGIGRFTNGKAVYAIGNLHGVIQQDATVLLPALYTKIIIHRDHFLARAASGTGGAWILFDSLGNRKTARQYEQIIPLENTIYAVKSKGFWGVVNEIGQEVIAPVYDSLLQYKDENIVVRFKGLFGVINISEQWVIPPRQNRLYLLNKDRYLEFAPDHTALKAISGAVIYFSSNPLAIASDGLLERVSSGDIWKISFDGIIVDRQVRPAEPIEAIYEESEGYRAIKKNGRYGFVDSKGRLRIANRYEAVQPFKEGFSAVRILGKWGFINVHDNLTVQPVYETVWPFNKGTALVMQKGQFGLIDTKGRLILPVRYESIERLETGNLLVRQNGLFGLLDDTGKMLIGPRYDRLHDTGTGNVICEKDSKYGVISVQGISTIPLIYDYIIFDRYTGVFLAMQKSSWKSISL